MKILKNHVFGDFIWREDKKSDFGCVDREKICMCVCQSVFSPDYTCV